VAFCFELVDDEGLECFGVEGDSELAVADFLGLLLRYARLWWEGQWGKADLDIASHVILDRGESHGAEHVCERRTSLLANWTRRYPIWVASEICIPNNVVRDSAASRNSDVAIPLSFSLSTGTSTNDRFNVSNHVPFGGISGAEAIVSRRCCCCNESRQLSSPSDARGFWSFKFSSTWLEHLPGPGGDGMQTGQTSRHVQPSTASRVLQPVPQTFWGNSSASQLNFLSDHDRFVFILTRSWSPACDCMFQ
jgi:hypothetical protein